MERLRIKSSNERLVIEPFIFSNFKVFNYLIFQLRPNILITHSTLGSEKVMLIISLSFYYGLLFKQILASNKNGVKLAPC